MTNLSCSGIIPGKSWGCHAFNAAVRPGVGEGWPKIFLSPRPNKCNTAAKFEVFGYYTWFQVSNITKLGLELKGRSTADTMGHKNDELIF